MRVQLDLFWNMVQQLGTQPLLSVDNVQNQSLKIITGAMKTTPISAIEEVTGVQPLQDRWNMKILLQAEKFECQLDHSMRAKVEGSSRGRLKQDSFCISSK